MLKHVTHVTSYQNAARLKLVRHQKFEDQTNKQIMHKVLNTKQNTISCEEFDRLQICCFCSLMPVQTNAWRCSRTSVSCHLANDETRGSLDGFHKTTCRQAYKSSLPMRNEREVHSFHFITPLPNPKIGLRSNCLQPIGSIEERYDNWRRR